MAWNGQGSKESRGRWPRFLVCLLLFVPLQVWADAGGDRVVLQLKWKHQFQFAGYYAALEQGYYREAGLDVELREAQSGEEPSDVVLSGRAEFGVATSELALLRSQGKPVVVLAAIFQHSPLMILARRDRGIASVRDLADKTVMLMPSEAEIFAYLGREGLRVDQLRPLPHSFDCADLLAGRCDAYVGCATDEPFLLRQAGLDLLQFSPRSSGIDFYGDCLYTTEAQTRRDPARVKAFREASLRGWHYALAHPEELVDLIRARYATRKTREHLLFEAAETARLVQPGDVELGSMHPGRWRAIADTYAETGLARAGASLEGFVYRPQTKPPPSAAGWNKACVGLGSVALAGLVGLAAVRWRRIRRMEREALARSLFDRDAWVQAFLQASTDPLVLVDVAAGNRFTVKRVNPSQARLSGRPEAELIGLELKDLLGPEAVPDLLGRLRHCAATGVPALHEDTAKGLRTETRLWPVLDAAGGVAGLLIATRTSSAEEAGADTESHAAKLESLGLMAGAIAHDFNNLFQSVLGNLELASLHPDQAAGDLERAKASLERAADLSRRMLDFSGKGFRDLHPIDLGPLLEDLPARLPKGLSGPDRFKLQTLESGLRIEGDAPQVRQVIEALVLNGLEALEGDRGLVTLRIFAFPFSQATHREGLWPLVPGPGPKACVEVRDTGPGITREHLERLFEPFFSTKAHGRGLGLAAALGILRAHGAGLQVLSEMGLGTTLRVYFARIDAAEPPASPGPAAIAQPAKDARRKILLVDDEPALRETLTDLLHDVLGYEVLAAEDGLEAESVYRDHQHEIGLILMDATMPRRGGVEAFQAIRAIRPDARALLISGFGEAFGQETARAHGFLGFLKKPFRLTDLRQALAEALPDVEAP